jgi:hypothetical protein
MSRQREAEFTGALMVVMTASMVMAQEARRVERWRGSRCSALCRKYVDGAIGTTRQIDSTPYTVR